MSLSLVVSQECRKFSPSKNRLVAWLHLSKPPIPYPAVLTILRENGILKILRAARGRRSAIYVFPELLNAAEGKDVF